MPQLFLPSYKGRLQNMTKFPLCVFPTNDYFLWKQSPKIGNCIPAFTEKVGKEIALPPLMGEIVPNQNVNPISEDSGVLKNWEYGVLGSFVFSRLLGLEMPTFASY